MKIYGRRYLEAIALAVHRPLRPVVQALGIDAKRLYEFAYWKSRQIEEGTLDNSWYQWMFTTLLNLTPEFYAGKRILDIGSGPRGSLEWADMAAERVCLDPLVPRYRTLGIDHHKARYVDARPSGFHSQTAVSTWSARSIPSTTSTIPIRSSAR